MMCLYMLGRDIDIHYFWDMGYMFLYFSLFFYVLVSQTIIY